MKLELHVQNNGSVFIGDKLGIKTKFIFEEDTSILWSGISLIANPPCKKQELQIAKSEIFPTGFFKAGEYIRERSILIKSNVVPTIKKRKLEYTIQLILRKENPINPSDEIIIKKSQSIEIRAKESILQVKQPNKISFSLSGLNILLTKDVFKAGETIKINYSSKNLKDIEIRLLQKSNLICYCTSFGKNCTNVEELPPAIAGIVKTSNIKEGYILLKIPENAESSHNYLWEPSEKEHWGMKFGDYTEWSLLILGHEKPEFGRNIIRFELPLTIFSKSIYIEKKEGIDLFAKSVNGGLSIFKDVSSKFHKRFEIISIDPNSKMDPKLKKMHIRIKNISNVNLRGITIKLSGLQEGLFETSSNIRGFNSWGKDEIKELIYETRKNISALIIVIEDNSLKTERIQTQI